MRPISKNPQSPVMTPVQYNACVDQYADQVYRFILHHIKDEDEAKDIVQDTFEKLWINAWNINYEKAKSYMFTTAYHTLVDKVRRNKKMARFEEVNSQDHYHTEQFSDLKEILNEAVSNLPEIQKSVILLRDYEGYSYEEIGEITGLSESQVKVYIFRARTFLKEYIGSIRNVI